MTSKQEEYFRLRYVNKITNYKIIFELEKSLVDANDAKKSYANINDYFMWKMGVKLEELMQIKRYFSDYHKLYKDYYNDDREFFFSKPVELINWFKEQNYQCGYCGVTKDELKEIAISRGLKQGLKRNFTLNKGKKRSQGTLEIERLNSDQNKDKNNGYEFNNCILACPLCNNAKSNLIDQDAWRGVFVDPMRKYYKQLLGKDLTNPKPS